MSGWWPRGRWRSSLRGRLRERLLVLTGLVAFVGAVYVAVVIVVGLLVGSSDAPSPLLSVVATAIVAVGFEPVRRRLQAWAHRLPGRPHPLPYEVLAHFAPDSGASAQETPMWMAKVSLTGWVPAGSRCGCWPAVDIRPAGVRPEGDGEPPAPPELTDDPRPMPGRHVPPVRHSGELLGVLVVEEREVSD